MRALLLAFTVLLAPFTSGAAESPTPCVELTESQTAAAELATKIAESRLAAVTAWNNADGVSTTAEQCDAVVWQALGRLVKLNTPDAAKRAADLLLDPKLQWDAGDALMAVDVVARMGKLVTPYLRPRVSESALARLTVECIEKELRSCM
jgi:hypothetical protein